MPPGHKLAERVHKQAGKKLTKQRERILDALLANGGPFPTHKAWQQAAGVPHRTFYNALHDPVFAQALQLAMVQRLRLHVPAIVDSLATEAKGGSYNHQKLALEITGIYVPREERQITQDTRILVWDTSAELARLREQRAKERAIEGHAIEVLPGSSGSADT